MTIVLIFDILFSALTNAQEKYSRGRRGAPAKGVGRATGARVQIPLSPFLANSFKKLLTRKNRYDKISELLEESKGSKSFEKNKKLLDKLK